MNEVKHGDLVGKCGVKTGCLLLGGCRKCSRDPAEL